GARVEEFCQIRSVESAATLCALRRARTEKREHMPHASDAISAKHQDCDSTELVEVNPGAFGASTRTSLPPSSSPGGYVVGLMEAKKRARHIIEQQEHAS